MIAAAPAPAMSIRDTVRSAIVARHGPRTHIYSILVKGPYALAQGSNLHDGLHKTSAGWRIVCRLPNGTAQVTTLQSRCGFPANVAAVLSVEEPINFAASQGNFSAAKAVEQRAYASAKGPQREIDRARLQLLTQLDLQMRLQTITRDQAMRQWNSLRYSWALPW